MILCGEIVGVVNPYVRHKKSFDARTHFIHNFI